METLVFILRFIIYIVTAHYFIKLLDYFVQLKPTKRARPLAYFSFSIITTVIIYNFDPVNIFYTMLGFFVVMGTLYSGSWIRRISMVLIFYPIIVTINFLAKNILTFIYSLNHNSIDYTSVSYLSLTFLDNILSCVFWIGVYHLFQKHMQKESYILDDKMWLLIDLICLAPFFSIYSLIIFTPYGKEYQIYIPGIACIITNLGITLLINTIAHHIHARVENQYFKLQHHYYTDLEKNQLEIRKIRHDMANHLSVIGMMLETEQYDKAKTYFKSLENQFPVSNKQFCTHSLINAVINAKYSLALSHEIDCCFNIDLQKLVPIEDVDLCSLLGNTLDNAIEACLKIASPQSRHLSVKVRVDKGFFTYEIINTYCTPVVMENDKYQSSKANKAHHGFGLENIKHIVAKYHGILEINPNSTEFSVLVMIPY